MKEKDADMVKEKEDKLEIEGKKKKEEWYKREKLKIIEQRKEYMNYIKGVMQKKGFNPKSRKDKNFGGVKGKG